MSDTRIHYSDYSSQPYVRIMCKNVMEYVWCSDDKTLPENVYKTEDGTLYTFEENNVTCETCKKMIQNQKRS